MSTMTKLRAPVFIGGEEREPVGGTWVDDVDPATAAPFAVMARGSGRDVDAAVTSALAVQLKWAAAGPESRGRVLIRIADLIERDRDTLARVESQDVGKPLSQAVDDVAAAAGYFRFYGEAVGKINGEVLPLPGGFAMIDRVPRGVTGHILPWNYPIELFGRSVAPSLAAGNACVVKPAEEAPLTSVAVGRLAVEAGLPPGVLNIVPGLGEEAGAALAAHPALSHVSFTGSREVGILVARASALHARPVMLELGGKSPSVVLQDADVPSMVRAVHGSIIPNTGQTCSANTRILVARAIHDEVVGALVEDLRGLSMGPGLDDKDLGPLISKSQLARVTGYVDRASEEGGNLLVGGHRPAELPGYFFEPTVFDVADASVRIAQEEVFGPVVTVLTFASDDEAVAYANGTVYDLVASVWTQDIDRAFAIARSLRAGQVFINNWSLGSGQNLPFGGARGSGYGREKGLEALREYTTTKTTVVRVKSAIDGN
jgi:aldehyde dehydrogenase (NAD+)